MIRLQSNDSEHNPVTSVQSCPRENALKRNRLAATVIMAMTMFLTTASVLAGNMNIVWTDAVGDFGPGGDVVSAQLSFDSTGAWTATWAASADHPFTGYARFNLNLFDTALGNGTTAIAPQVSLDWIQDFGVQSTTFFSYSGTTPYLANWQIGDQVSTGNSTNFLSGVVAMNTPYGRDNLVSVATIVGAIPEPGTFAMMLAGLGMLGFTARRGKRNAA